MNCYSSIDLVNWYQIRVGIGRVLKLTTVRKFEGVLAAHPGSRTHILYNEASKKYILWAGKGSFDVGYSVSTASSPTSQFELVGTAAINPNTKNIIHGDFSVFQLGNKAYMAWAALNPYDPRQGSLWPVIYQTMHTAVLTSDWVSKEAAHTSEVLTVVQLNVSETNYNVTSAAFDLVDQELESPDIFERNGLFCEYFF